MGAVKMFSDKRIERIPFIDEGEWKLSPRKTEFKKLILSPDEIKKRWGIDVSAHEFVIMGQWTRRERRSFCFAKWRPKKKQDKQQANLKGE